MRQYNKLVSLTTNPNHASTLKEYPKLENEDVSFYGLLTAAMFNHVVRFDELPGSSSWQFTTQDKNELSLAMFEAGITRVESDLEICTLGDENLLPIRSEYFTFAGFSEHGLHIASSRVGRCSAAENFN